MENDQTAAELISKSLRYKLEAEEEAEVTSSLEASEEARRYSKLSQVIQQSCAEVAKSAEEGDASIAPPLSTDAKKRLKASVTGAVLRESRRGGTSRNEADQTQIGASGAGVNRPLEIRKSLSRFDILRKLGEGGLGTVWLAKDEKLRRTVAIKEMKEAALDSPAAWHRFHREAEITGHLEHPGIVPLYQFGIDSQTQQPFYAMRFVGKRTLQDAITEHHEKSACRDTNRLRLHRLLTNFLRVCEAIGYAHSRGVVHRDLKPENIAIDSFGQVIVLDWGLAKILDTAELGTQMLIDGGGVEDSDLLQTMAGEAIGTPLYMSPEQAAGDLDSVDERTDVYGLGAILFSILTGHAPHEKTATAMDSDIRIKAILETIATGDTPRASEYQHCVPRVLEEICTRAMSRRRFARYESASELAEAVEHWMVGQTNRAALYENLRMEGRELKNDFQAGVDDLESNVRFASLLPPVQELIHAKDEEQDSVWRERLATIFIGLLRAKPSFNRIVYQKLDGEGFTEIVRVERHSTDRSTVRKVPRSRLRTGEISDFIRRASEMQPEEVLTSLVCDPTCDKTDRCDEPHLVAALPVYDEQSEEPYGVIMIDCDLKEVFEKQLRRRWSAGEIMAACDTFHTLMHAVDGHIVEASSSKPVKDVSPHFEPAIATLQTELEFIDDTNMQVYGARIWLIEKVHGVMYLLRAKE